jgi:hypothetical protein
MQQVIINSYCRFELGFFESFPKWDFYESAKIDCKKFGIKPE